MKLREYVLWLMLRALACRRNESIAAPCECVSWTTGQACGGWLEYDQQHANAVVTICHSMSLPQKRCQPSLANTRQMHFTMHPPANSPQHPSSPMHDAPHQHSPPLLIPHVCFADFHCAVQYKHLPCLHVPTRGIQIYFGSEPIAWDIVSVRLSVYKAASSELKFKYVADLPSLPEVCDCSKKNKEALCTVPARLPSQCHCNHMWLNT